MLVDEVSIKVVGGHGGRGAVSFRREKFVPKGGPDGGNGGRGGNVYVIGENNPYLLKKFRERPLIEAENGQPGADNNKTGHNAPDLTIKVPYGTRITNLKSGGVFDILDERSRYLLARGGWGGRGNTEFATATNQTPRNAEPGDPGKEINYKLELMLIADVGLIGLPNAGKSTLLNALTHSNAKVAAYPFTTLEPNLGALDNLVIADIPGLIEGASAGRGLGYQFLRHVERTRLLLHCVSCENLDLKKTYEVIRDELKAYSARLAERPELILITKFDLLDEKELKKLKTKVKKLWSEALWVSVLDDQSILELRKKLESLVKPRRDNIDKTLE